MERGELGLAVGPESRPRRSFLPSFLPLLFAADNQIQARKYVQTDSSGRIAGEAGFLLLLLLLLLLREGGDRAGGRPID